MSYSNSLAKKSALSRIKDLKLSFVYVKIRTRKLPTFARDSVFQNCVFQLSAIFEDYLGELTTRWFYTLANVGAPNSTLPLNTRALFVAKIHEEAFKRFHALGDETELVKRIIESQSAFLLFDQNSPIPNLDFRSQLVKDRKFPSVKNLDQLFKRLDLAKIFAKLSART